MVREFRNVNLETGLHRCQFIRILLRSNEADGEALGAETPSTTNAVQILIAGFVIDRLLFVVTWSWEVVVDNNIDFFDVNTATEEVSSYKDALLELLELLVLLDTIILLHARVDAHGWEVALLEEAIQFDRAADLANEDNNLVEVERVQKVAKFAVLLVLLEFNVVLDQTVEGELGITIDEDFEWLSRKSHENVLPKVFASVQEHTRSIVATGRRRKMKHVSEQNRESWL